MHNSHDQSVLQSIDITRRNLMLITLRASRVKGIMSRGYCFCSSLLFFCISTLYLITHTQNAPEELLRRYQEALTIIIIIYLVNFACMALKLGKVGPTTCISSFNPCPPLPSVAIERFHMTSRWPYWCSKTIKRRPCWCTKPVLWELISFLT